MTLLAVPLENGEHIPIERWTSSRPGLRAWQSRKCNQADPAWQRAAHEDYFATAQASPSTPAPASIDLSTFQSDVRITATLRLASQET